MIGYQYAYTTAIMSEYKREVVIINCCVCANSIVVLNQPTSKNMLENVRRYSVEPVFMSTTCIRCKDKIEASDSGAVADEIVIGTSLVFNCPTYNRFANALGVYPRIMSGNMHTIVHPNVVMRTISFTDTIYNTVQLTNGGVEIVPYEKGSFF